MGHHLQWKFTSADRGMYSVKRRLVALLVVALCVLAGCSKASDGAQASDVAVIGIVGARPTVTFDAPLDIKTQSSKILSAGTDAPLKDGDTFFMNYVLMSAADGSVVADSYDAAPVAQVYSKDIPGGWIYDALKDVPVGSRVLKLLPGSTTSDPEPGIIAVFDLIYPHAQGQEMPPRDGAPTVTRDASGAPTISVAPGLVPPVDIVAQTLIKGSGPQVEAGQTITVKFVGANWSDGSVFESSWVDGKKPATMQIGVGELIGGWDEGLIEQTVGSQVMIMVPATASRGALVYVVDILAAQGTPVATATPTPDPAEAPAAPAEPSASPTEPESRAIPTVIGGSSE